MKKLMNLHNLLLTALFTALISVSAFIRLPTPPLPITLQNLTIILAGIILGSKLGSLSVIIYIAIGLCGLPIFSGGGGPGYALQPGFGYLLGFIPAAFISGFLVRRIKTKGFVKYIIASFTGFLLIYFIGIPYYYFFSLLFLEPASIKVILMSHLIFLPGDLLKCCLAAFTGYNIQPRVKKL